MLFPSLLGAVLVLCTTLLIYRTLTLVYDHDHRPIPNTRRTATPTRLLIVLGSGGHTAEMFALLRDLDTQKYSHRSYIVSSGDLFSARKAGEFEQRLAERDDPAYDSHKAKLQGQPDAAGSFDIAVVPRARRVHQSLLTTPYSSLRCLFAAMQILKRPKTMPPSVVQVRSGSEERAPLGYPELMLTNGPGTGVIVVLASFIVRLLGLRGTEGKMHTIYVESWARVRRLSLSGKILLRVVDRFIVQWETLIEATNGRAEYIGVLV